MLQRTRNYAPSRFSRYRRPVPARCKTGVQGSSWTQANKQEAKGKPPCPRAARGNRNAGPGDGCNQLPVQPVDQGHARCHLGLDPAGLTVNVHVPQDESRTRRPARAPRNITVALPRRRDQSLRRRRAGGVLGGPRRLEGARNWRRPGDGTPRRSQPETAPPREAGEANRLLNRGPTLPERGEDRGSDDPNTDPAPNPIEGGSTSPPRTRTRSGG